LTARLRQGVALTIAVNYKIFFTDFFKSDLKTKIKYLKLRENQKAYD